MTVFICHADLYATTMVCGRCNQSWPKGGNPKPCKAKADPAIGFDDMIDTLERQARLMTAGQWALVAAGTRTSPYMPELRKAAVLDAAAQLLARIKGDKKIVELLKSGASNVV